MVCNAIKSLAFASLCLFPAAVARADGAVYAMTNALANNEVLAYHRDTLGNLSHVQTIGTGGGGSGLQLAGVDSLGSAGSIQLSSDHKLLFVVNTESAAENNGAGAYNTDCEQGTITSYRVAADGTLTFADRVFSGGLFPNSLTVSKIKFARTSTQNEQGNDNSQGSATAPVSPSTIVANLYVLNAGGPEAPAICHLTPDTANTPNVTGFKVDAAGHMIPLDSTQPIDPGPASAASGVSCTAAAAAGFSGLTGAPAADFQCGLNPPSFPRSPAEVKLAPSGTQLVVTVKGTNAIYVFPIGTGGIIGATPTITQAPGPALPTYFGFAFNALGDLLVTELFGTATSIPAGGKGSLSSFVLTTTGQLQAISSDVADGGTAACWIAIEPLLGKFAYVSNNLSASISSYALGANGVVTLLAGVAASGAGPNDLATAVDGNNSFLYVVDAGTGTVGAFHINGDGSLTPITGGSGLPAGRSAQGLAAY